MTAVGTPLLHTPEAAAERLQIARTRVYELIKDGSLKSVKIGRSRRIPEDALRDFIAQLTETAA